MTAKAPEGSSESVNSRITDSALHLDWSPQQGATHYLLVDDRSQKVLWRGEDTSAELPLKAPTSTDVLLVAATAAGTSTVAEVLATQPRAASRVTPLVTVTTENGTTAAWGAIPNVPSYEVEQGQPDGMKPLGNSPVTRTQLPTSLGGAGRFTITGDPVEPPEKAQQDVTKRYGVEIVPPSTNAGAVPADAQVGEVLTQSSQPAQATTRTSTDYQTYIPRDYVDAPESFTDFPCEGSWGGPDWHYSGDQRRGPVYNSEQYRTRGNYMVNWQQQNTNPFKSVSPTSRYERTDDGRYVYDSTRLASDEDFHPRVISNDGNYARNVIEHEVGNPYCTSLAGITYASQQDLYRNGGHWIYGSHDKMPNHQLYRTDYHADGTRDIELIFNHEFEDPRCLFSPVCGSRQYQYVR
ncbi:hypothetical protein [Salinifilum aidingensis]